MNPNNEPMTAEKLIDECRLQLQYLNDKFKETGTTNSLLAKIEAHQSARREQCNHVFQRVERGGEFQGNQCECGEWEDLT